MVLVRSGQNEQKIEEESLKMKQLNWRYATMFATLGVLASPNADAASFSLNLEKNAALIGQAGAGSATATNPAGMSANPASMVYAVCDKQKIAMEAAAVFVAPTAKATIHQALSTGGVTMTGGNGGNAGKSAVVPSAFIMWHVNEKVRLGLGLTVPFGLSTTWASDWQGRQRAIESKLETVDVNPSIAFKLNNFVSVGAGVSFLWGHAKLSKAPFSQTVLADNGIVTLEGSDVGYGFNGGIMVKPREHTRLGLSYRSPVKLSVRGTLTHNLTAASVGAAGFSPTGSPVFAALTLPETVTFSIHHDVNKKWSVMADALFTRWSRFDRLVTDTPAATGATYTSSTETYLYKNTWLYALGVNYKHCDALLFKAGVGYDQSPTRNEFRDFRIPDQDRIFGSAGVSYAFMKNLKGSLDYTFVKARKPKIQLAGNTSVGTVNATINAYAHVVGVGLRYAF